MKSSTVLHCAHLRYGAPSAVARVSVLHAMQILDWENGVEEWIADCDILLNRRDCVRTLMKQYVPLILHEIEHEIKAVVPVYAAGLVQTLCHLLDALVTNENIPKHVEDESKYIEKYFAFAAIWAFGSCLSNENKRLFSVWWRATFKSVRLPGKGTVFDYYLKKSEFISWATLLEGEQVETRILQQQQGTSKDLTRVPSIGRAGSVHRVPSGVQSAPQLNTSKSMNVFIHTADTIAARTVGGLASMMHMDLLLVGDNGSGKTALVEEMLKQLPKDYTKAHYQINYMSDAAAVQNLLEGVLEKKAGKNFGPIASKYLAFFLDDMSLEAVDPYGAQSGLELIRQLLGYKSWYDRGKFSLRILNATQVIGAINPARGNNAVNDRLLRHFFVYSKEYASESLTSIFTTTLKTHFDKYTLTATVDDTFVNKLVLSTIEMQAKMAGLFKKGIDTFHYDFGLRHQLAVLDGLKFAGFFLLRFSLSLALARLLSLSLSLSLSLFLSLSRSCCVSRTHLCSLLTRHVLRTQILPRSPNNCKLCHCGHTKQVEIVKGHPPKKRAIYIDTIAEF